MSKLDTNLYFRPAIRSFLRELAFFIIGLTMYLFPLLILTMIMTYVSFELNYNTRKLIFVFTHYIGLTLMFWATLSVCIVILANRYNLTSEYVESVWGIIARKTARIELTSIRTVNVSQGVVDRLLGVGVISFASAGTSGQDVIFRRIKYPFKLQTLVNSRRHAVTAYKSQAH